MLFVRNQGDSYGIGLMFYKIYLFELFIQHRRTTASENAVSRGETGTTVVVVGISTWRDTYHVLLFIKIGSLYHI